MKKGIFAVLVFLILCFLSIYYINIEKQYNDLKRDNNDLIIEIDKVKDDIESKINSNNSNNKEIDNLKNINEEKLKELNIWLKIKEKLENSL